jgi:hypothetical protein
VDDVPPVVVPVVPVEVCVLPRSTPETTATTARLPPPAIPVSQPTIRFPLVRVVM